MSDNPETMGGLNRGDFPKEFVNDFPVTRKEQIDFLVKRQKQNEIPVNFPVQNEKPVTKRYRISVLNWLIKVCMGKDYADKLDLLIKQGIYHANTGEGPYLKLKENK